MNSAETKLKTVFLSIAFIPFWVLQDVHGYIDLGTGSFILQVIIGFLVGALFALKVYWRKFSSFFRRIFSALKVGKDKNGSS